MSASQRNGLPLAGIGHPQVRRFLDIKRGRTPSRADAVALEGLWAVRYAIEAAAQVEVAFVCPALVRGEDTWRTLDQLALAGVTAFEVSERVLRRMTERDGPD